jgi:tetratricopeptide (TPR) repeat protein
MRFNLEPLTKLKAQAELAANSEIEQEMRERWVEWYGSFLNQIKEKDYYDYHKVEASNLKSVIDWLIKQNRMDDASCFFRRSRQFFLALGRWGVLARQAEHILTWAETIEDTALLADILKPLTDIFLWQADFAYGKSMHERIRHAAQRLRDEILLAEVRLDEVKILCRHSPSSQQEEIEISMQVLQVFRNYNKTEQVVDALNTLGNLHLKLRDFAKAVSFYEEGLGLLGAATNKESQDVRQLRAALRGNLAHVAGRQGHFADACKILRGILQELTDPYLAEAYVTLALYEYELGHVQQAHQLRQKADGYIRQFNMTRPICPEDEEWSRRFS